MWHTCDNNSANGGTWRYSEGQVAHLHELLAPHILRRVKKDVLAGMIPPKKELIVRVELQPLQRKIYKAVLAKDLDKLR